MRINRFVASAIGVGRRQADKLVAKGRIKIDGELALTGQNVSETQTVTIDSKKLNISSDIYILLNKPPGYVVSRNGQGSETIYSLLPDKYKSLKPVGRLDKQSQGLLILTTDGKLSYELTHPKFNKQKVYEVTLNRDISEPDIKQLSKGVILEDGLSKIKVNGATGKELTLSLSEGRNRQIRRTFDKLGYKVVKLNRTQFGKQSLGTLEIGKYREFIPW